MVDKMFRFVQLRSSACTAKVKLSEAGIQLRPNIFSLSSAPNSVFSVVRLFAGIDDINSGELLENFTSSKPPAANN